MNPKIVQKFYANFEIVKKIPINASQKLLPNNFLNFYAYPFF
jgi:hypothetical protein